MSTQGTFISGALTLEVIERDADIVVLWRGRSTEREPAQFILPVLNQLLSGRSEEKRIVLDFTELAYMNSSTITPIIRFLDQVKRGSRSVLVKYQRALKWQELSFAALGMFKTRDQRIQIYGA